MELIEREAAIALIEQKQKELCPVGMFSRNAVYGTDRDRFDAWDEIIDQIDALPTIEAAPVVHGRWEEVDWVEPDGHSFGTVRILKAGLQCNKCANVFRKKLLWKDNYCPNCGARMDGGEEHEN